MRTGRERAYDWAVAEGMFLEDTIALLDRTPRAMRELLWGLPEKWLGAPDVAGGWTAHDVVGHLISAEEANWIPRVTRLLEKGTSEAFDGFDRFAHVEREAGVPLGDLLDRFSALRAASLVELRELVGEEADLERRGRHPELGEVTLRQLLASWTIHDLDHLQQIFASLAGTRDEMVGPWKAYLGILLRRDAAAT